MAPFGGLKHSGFAPRHRNGLGLQDGVDRLPLNACDRRSAAKAIVIAMAQARNPSRERASPPRASGRGRKRRADPGVRSTPAGI
jgi:hypothetical protein